MHSEFRTKSPIIELVERDLVRGKLILRLFIPRFTESVKNFIECSSGFPGVFVARYFIRLRLISQDSFEGAAFAYDESLKRVSAHTIQHKR